MNHTRFFQSLLLIVILFSSFSYIANSLTAVLILLTAIIAYSSAIKRQYWQCYSSTNLMLVYLIWLFVVKYSSHVPDASNIGLSFLLGLPVMFLISSNTQNFAETWKNIRIIFFFMGFGLAVWAIWQIIRYGYNPHRFGPLRDRNLFAALMNLLWFPCIYLLISNKLSTYRIYKYISALGLFVISVAIFATSSRGGIVTWTLLFPILLWACYRYSKSWLLVALISALVLVAYLSSSMILHINIGDRNFQLTQDGSISARWLIWQSAMRMALNHPIIGTGWYTFSAYYPAYRSPLENSTTGIYVHNDYLQFLTEGGITAFLILISMLLGLLFQLWRSLKKCSDDGGFESTTLLLGLLAVFIHASVNFIFYFAFINIISGLYFARATQLIENPRLVNVIKFSSIRPSVKRFLLGFVFIILVSPFCLRLISQVCLVGTKPGMQVVNLFAPKATAQDVANMITAFYPQEQVAQEYMLATSESLLEDQSVIKQVGIEVQHAYLLDAISRFEQVRKQTANNPNFGVREVVILMEHHAAIDSYIIDGKYVLGVSAFEKAHQIISDNLKMNPYHTDSMIMLARLQAKEGHLSDALNTLHIAGNNSKHQIDNRLTYVEVLRLLAYPKHFPELEVIERKLRNIQQDLLLDKPINLPANFGQNLDNQLKVIEGKIKNAY